jgi:hypothetical protein
MRFKRGPGRLQSVGVGDSHHTHEGMLVTKASSVDPSWSLLQSS